MKINLAIMGFVRSLALMCLLLLFVPSCSKKQEPHRFISNPYYKHELALTLLNKSGQSLIDNGLDISGFQAIGVESHDAYPMQLSLTSKEIRISFDHPTIYPPLENIKKGDLRYSTMIVRYKQSAISVKCVFEYRPTEAYGLRAVYFVKAICEGRSFEGDDKGKIVLPLRLVDGKLSLVEG